MRHSTQANETSAGAAIMTTAPRPFGRHAGRDASSTGRSSAEVTTEPMSCHSATTLGLASASTVANAVAAHRPRREPCGMRAGSSPRTRQSRSRPTVVAAMNAYESIVLMTVAIMPRWNRPHAIGGRVTSARRGNAITGSARSGSNARAYRPHAVVMRSNTTQNTIDHSTPLRATCGSRAAYARCQNAGSTIVPSAITYQTRIAAGPLPPCQCQCIGGTRGTRKASPPCCTTRNPSITAKPPYMSANCIWSVRMTVRSPPRST